MTTTTDHTWWNEPCQACAIARRNHQRRHCPIWQTSPTAHTTYGPPPQEHE
jgi:hypothetical protein